jgi:Acetyltransferase (GNAT) domain
MTNAADASLEDIVVAAGALQFTGPNAPLESGGADLLHVSWHRGDLPDSFGAELARLYGNVYASLPHMVSAGLLDDETIAYAARRGGEAVALFLFRCDGCEARVLNEGMRMNDAHLDRFAKDVFTQYPQIDVISLHAIHGAGSGLSLPHWRFNCLEDIVLTLPRTAEDYLAHMGGATRSYIKRYLNKLRRDFPGHVHEILVGNDIDEQLVHDIIALNRARMDAKGKAFGIDAAELRRILYRVRECGMISVIRIDGRVCAGTVNYETGGNYFLDVIAHDPAYNDYRLGTLVCYLTICECIRRGGGEYHFLWGEHDYKYRLLGVRRDLDHLTIYRSRARRTLHIGIALRNLRLSMKRQLQLQIRAARQDSDSAGARLLDMLERVRSACFRKS